MIKAIIIEDEEPARILIKNYLKSSNEIEIIGEFADGFSGVKAINELKPQLVFIDIQMPKLTGLEVLELAIHKPAVIFITAYDEFAVKAFEMNAIDYLLKPYSRERFTLAVNKAMKNIQNNNNQLEAINNIAESIIKQDEVIERIAVRSGQKIVVIPVNEIFYVEAEGDYVKIHTKDEAFLKEKTMKYLQAHLDNKQFLRIHRSFIVNAMEIQKIEYYDKDSHLLVLKNNTKLKISDEGYKRIRKTLNL